MYLFIIKAKAVHAKKCLRLLPVFQNIYLLLLGLKTLGDILDSLSFFDGYSEKTSTLYIVSFLRSMNPTVYLHFGLFHVYPRIASVQLRDEQVKRLVL